MAILGTAAHNLINLTGLYRWTGTAWAKISALGTTAGNDTVSALAGNDSVSAAAGNDIVHGNGGNDRIDGGAGDDQLYGDAGNDRLYGGTGGDAYVGGSGADTFVFSWVTDSKADSLGRFIDFKSDVIRDFTSIADTADASQRDKIDLHLLAEHTHHALKFTGTTATAHGVWSGDYSGNTYLSADTTGDKIADLVVKFGSIEKLAAGDFFLV